MLIRHRGNAPAIDPTAYIAPTAAIVGDVRVGSRARVMFGATIDAEGSAIEIGSCSIVCENAVIRATAAGDRDHPVRIADHVFISPHSTILGCRVERGSYIATGATILQGAHLHEGSSVAVGAFVHANTVLPPAFFVPPQAIAIGDPVTIFTPDQHEQIAQAIAAIGFANVAFGVDAAWTDRVNRYTQATEVRSREFGAHLEDAVIVTQEQREE